MTVYNISWCKPLDDHLVCQNIVGRMLSLNIKFTTLFISWGASALLESKDTPSPWWFFANTFAVTFRCFVLSCQQHSFQLLIYHKHHKILKYFSVLSVNLLFWARKNSFSCTTCFFVKHVTYSLRTSRSLAFYKSCLLNLLVSWNGHIIGPWHSCHLMCFHWNYQTFCVPRMEQFL